MVARRGLTDAPFSERRDVISALCITVMVWATSNMFVYGQSTGFQILSRTTTSEEVNGFSLQYEQVEYECSAAGTYNFQVQQANNTVGNYTVICPLVKQFYVQSIARQTPATARPTSAQACLIQNPSSFNISQLQNSNGFLTPRPPLYTRTNTTAPIGSFWGTVATIGTTVGCAGANTITYGLAGAFGGKSNPCNPMSQYLTLDAFSAYTDTQNTLWMNQDSLNINTQEWEGNATAEFKSLFKGFQDTQDYQTQNSYAVGNLTNLYSNQQDQINEITRQTAAGINNVQQQLVTTNQNTQNIFNDLVALTASTASEFNQTLIFFAAAVTNLSSQALALTNEVHTNARVVQSNGMTTAQSLAQLSIAIQQLASSSQYISLLRRVFTQNQDAVEALNTGDNNFQFFLDDVGLQGQRDPFFITDPDLIKFGVDVPSLSYIYTLNPGSITTKAIAVQTQVQMYCSGLWTALNQNSIASWVQLMNTLGNAGSSNCTTEDSIQGRNYCNCWMQVTERGCRMYTVPGTSGLPTDEAYNAWLAWDNPGFPDNTSLFCEQPPQDLPPLTNLTNNLIKSSNDFIIFQINLCQRGINPQSIPLGADEAGYTRFSPLFGQRNFAPYTEDSCVSNMVALMNPPTLGDFNVVYLLVNGFIAAFGMASTSQQLLTLAHGVIGTLPLNTTIVREEFVSLGPGPVGPCLTMYAVALEMNHWVGLYRYEKSFTLQEVTVLLNGQPFDTDDSGVLTNANSDLLPVDGSYIALPYLSEWVGSVYDIAYATNVPSPGPLDNLGKPHYPGIFSPTPLSFPDTYNLSLWRQINIDPFNHQGIVSYDIFKNALQCDSNDPPHCTCDPAQKGPASNGNICDMLEIYSVNSIGGNFVQFTSDSDRLVGTIKAPQGQLVSISGSACLIPSLSTAVDSNFNQQTVTLYNPLSTNNEVEIQRSGACGGARDKRTFQPLQTQRYIIQACPLEPGVPISLTIYNSAGGVFTQCNTSISVTVTPQNPVQTGIGLSFEGSESRTLTVTDQALLNAQNVQATASLQFITLTTAIIQTFTRNQIALAQSGDPLGAFAPVYALFNLTAEGISDALIDSKNQTFSYLPNIQNYTDINLAILNQVREANAAAINATTRLGKDIQDAQINLLNLIQLNEAGALLLNQSEISLALMNDVVNQILAGAFAVDPLANIDDILDPLGNFLVGVGNFPGATVSKVVDGLEALGGDALDAAGKMFGSLSGITTIVVIIVVVIIVVVIVIVLSVYLAKIVPANKSLEARVAALEAKAGVPTAGSMHRGGSDQDSSSGCKCCCPTKKRAKKRPTPQDDGYGGVQSSEL